MSKSLKEILVAGASLLFMTSIGVSANVHVKADPGGNQNINNLAPIARGTETIDKEDINSLNYIKAHPDYASSNNEDPQAQVADTEDGNDNDEPESEQDMQNSDENTSSGLDSNGVPLVITDPLGDDETVNGISSDGLDVSINNGIYRKIAHGYRLIDDPNEDFNDGGAINVVPGKIPGIKGDEVDYYAHHGKLYPISHRVMMEIPANASKGNPYVGTFAMPGAVNHTVRVRHRSKYSPNNIPAYHYHKAHRAKRAKRHYRRHAVRKARRRNVKRNRKRTRKHYRRHAVTKRRRKAVRKGRAVRKARIRRHYKRANKQMSSRYQPEGFAQKAVPRSQTKSFVGSSAYKAEWNSALQINRKAARHDLKVLNSAKKSRNKKQIRNALRKYNHMNSFVKHDQKMLNLK